MRKRFSGGNHTAFGCRIVGLARQSLQARERRHINDSTVFLAQHRLNERPSDVVERVERNAQHLIPVLRLHPKEQVVFADSSVIYQNLNIFALVRLLPFGQFGGGFLLVRDIKFQQFAVAACLLNQFQRVLRLGVVRHVVHNHLIAHLRQLDAHCAANSTASACY